MKRWHAVISNFLFASVFVLCIFIPLCNRGPSQVRSPASSRLLPPSPSFSDLLWPSPADRILVPPCHRGPPQTYFAYCVFVAAYIVQEANQLTRDVRSL